MDTIVNIGKFALTKSSERDKIVGGISALSGAATEFFAEKGAAGVSEEIGDYESALFQEQAKTVVARNVAEALKLKRAGRRLTAANIAQVGATGGVVAGSKLLAIADTQAEVELDARQIMLNARIEQAGLLTKGDIARYVGRRYATAANIRARQALFRGVKPAAGLIGTLAAKLTRKSNA